MDWKITQKTPGKPKEVSCTIDEIALMPEIREKLGKRSMQFAVDVSIKYLKEGKLTMDDLSKKYPEVGDNLESLVSLVERKLKGE